MLFPVPFDYIGHLVVEQIHVIHLLKRDVVQSPCEFRILFFVLISHLCIVFGIANLFLNLLGQYLDYLHTVTSLQNSRSLGNKTAQLRQDVLSLLCVDRHILSVLKSNLRILKPVLEQKGLD